MAQSAGSKLECSCMPVIECLRIKSKTTLFFAILSDENFFLFFFEVFKFVSFFLSCYT